MRSRNKQTRNKQTRNKQNGSAAPAANGQAAGQRAPAPAAPNVPGGAEPPPVPPPVRPAPVIRTPTVRRRRGLFRRLKNWRVRSRLLLLITIPTVAALVLGGTSMASSVSSALAFERVQQRAALADNIALLAQRLEDERDQTVYFITLPTGRAALLSKTASAARKAAAQEQLQVVASQQQATNQAVSQFDARLTQVFPSYAQSVQQEASTVQSLRQALIALRKVATESQIPALVVAQKYADGINDLLALLDATAQGASDAQLSQTVQVLSLVSQMKAQASEQRAILAAALIRGAMLTNELQTLTNAQGLQSSDQQAFLQAATPEQNQLWDNSVSRSFVYLASSEESQAIQLSSAGSAGGSLSLRTDPTTADDWYGAMTNEINYQLGGVERSLLASLTSRANSLRTAAVTSAVIIGGAVLLFLALALLFTAVVARSMVRPLRRLRAGALEVAGVRLPGTVRRMSEAEGAAGPPEVAPIDVDSTDEIGEVARAFDQVHREAIRLASNEAALRGNVNAMFVNLSRRSQSLVERQIRLIDDLEQGEQEPERLSSMFQLDHLATRMRRNSENLLVLAGHEASRRWTQAISLVDVLRAAVSEIEQYERVSLNVQPGISVRGQAVNDVVHLVAELAENATSFSAADTPVNVSGHVLSSGGALLDITDQGVGMGAEEMAHANWRLDNPPVVDVAVSRRMGLFVVARLAARHGIRVRLRPAAMGGLTALVWLPDEVVSNEGSAAPPGMRRFEVPQTPGGSAIQQPRGGWGADASADDRLATERAVNAALAPRFTPLRAEGEDTASFPVPPLNDLRPGTGSDREPDPPQRQAGMPGSPAVAGPIYGAPAAGSDVDSAPVARPADSGFAGAGYTDSGFAGAGYTDSGFAGTGYTDSGFADDNGGMVQQGVVVPPPALGPGEQNRLPIFESVESDWFRRGRKGTDRPASTQSVTPVVAAGTGWTSPADAGWQAAQAAAAPAASGTTKAGLPKRVPRANLVPGAVVPGAVSGEPAAPPAPVRSAAITRDRFASFQRGVREARAAVRDGETSVGEDNSGT